MYNVQKESRQGFQLDRNGNYGIYKPPQFE